MNKKFFCRTAVILGSLVLLNCCTTMAEDSNSFLPSSSSSEGTISKESSTEGRIIPLSRKELDKMGKGEFNVQISASAGEFPIDPNDFESPATGHLDTIKEGSVPVVEKPSPWNFGDVPIYYYNIVWSPLECLTGAYFYEVYYVQDTDRYVYRHFDISKYKDKSFYDAMLRDQFDPFTYGIPIFYFQVFRRSDFESPNAWVDVAGKQIQASSLPVWYEDENIVAADMTGYTFPDGFQAFLEEYQEKNIWTREDYNYTWLIKRNELWSRPPKSIFAPLQ